MTLLAELTGSIGSVGYGFALAEALALIGFVAPFVFGVG